MHGLLIGVFLVCVFVAILSLLSLWFAIVYLVVICCVLACVVALRFSFVLCVLL